MNEVLRISVGVLLINVSCLTFSHAQYFMYSQYNFTEQRVNPAAVGGTRYAEASLVFRDQKTGGDFSIRSNFLELSYPLLNASTGRPWAGLGISVHDDRSGGIFHMQEAALSYAVHLRLSRTQSLSMGMKVLVASREISYAGYYTGSQYVPDRGFDATIASGEEFYGYRNAFTTFSTGVFWEQTDRKGRRLHHLGISLFDFNRPEDSFLNTGGRLSSTFVAEGGFQAYSRSGINILPEALVTFSASNTFINTGVRIQKEFNITARGMSDRLELLAKYAVGRSGILGIQLHRENFSVGISYDFPVLGTNAGNMGALEVGVAIRKLVLTRVQKQAARRKKAADEKKAVIAKRNALKPMVAQNTKDMTRDTAAIIEPVVVEKQPPLSSYPDASAGRLYQEPVLIEKVTLHFSFDFNSSDLDDATEKFLDELASELVVNEQWRVQITGHTDNIGSGSFNLRLSQKRANVVRQYLIKRGIPGSRIRSEGRGMTEPLNGNQNDAERAMNRRVEITVLR
ncbi:MAG: PorP/SprF family type IX secretion system membrane protein [Cyclobacteriaceae bacterium]|nr:PorP/SprF family type IX secretion system membrane protein [Cyclobacteriaceae bacterium]